MQTKKLLGSALALAMMWPGQASAELLKNLKMSGSFELQGIQANNVTDFASWGNPDGVQAAIGLAAGETNNRDAISDVQHRLLVSLDWDLLDDVHARTTLRKNNRIYGNASEDLNAIQTAVFLDEAFVKVDKVFGVVDTTLGRQFVGTPGDMIAYYGPKENLYGLPVDAIDAVRVDWAGEMVTASALVAKPTANGGALGGGAAAEDADEHLRGLLLGLRGQDNIAAGAYIWNLETNRYGSAVGVPASQGNPVGVGALAGGRQQRLYVVGAKGKVMMGPLWLGGEFAKNYGTQRIAGDANNIATADYLGWAAMADVGAKLDIDGMAAFTPWGKFALGTGRQNNLEDNEAFQAINPDFRPGIVYGRFASNTGSDFLGSAYAPAGSAMGAASNSLSNRVIYGFGLKVNPAAANKLTVGLSFWDFRLHRANRSTGNQVMASGQKHLGNEVDLDLTWQHSDNVSFGAGFGRFQAGSYIQEYIQSTRVAQNAAAVPNSIDSQQPVNQASVAYFDVKIKWGGQQ